MDAMILKTLPYWRLMLLWVERAALAFLWGFVVLWPVVGLVAWRNGWIPLIR